MPITQHLQIWLTFIHDLTITVKFFHIEYSSRFQNFFVLTWPVSLKVYHMADWKLELSRVHVKVIFVHVVVDKASDYSVVMFSMLVS